MRAEAAHGLRGPRRAGRCHVSRGWDRALSRREGQEASHSATLPSDFESEGVESSSCTSILFYHARLSAQAALDSAHAGADASAESASALKAVWYCASSQFHGFFSQRDNFML